MNHRLQLLHTLREREERRRDEAAAAWRKASQVAEQARQQAAALGTYRDEYRQRWAAQFSLAAPIEIVRCYQGFIQRLDHAIVAQQQQVERVASREAAAQAVLRQRELKLATVKRLIERRVAALQQALERRDQKLSDEIAQRRAWAQPRGLDATAA